MFQVCPVGASGRDHLPLFVALHRYRVCRIIDTLAGRIVKECFSNDHSLSKQPLNRFIELNQADISHDLCPEAGVDEMHHRMVVTANILINRGPKGGNVRRERQDLIIRIGVTKVVPG